MSKFGRSGADRQTRTWLCTLALLGCSTRGERESTDPGTTSSSSEHNGPHAPLSLPTSSNDEPQTVGGTGKVQGSVRFGGKPAAGIEVKLCQTFNRWFGGCEGKTYKTRTDKNGNYVIADVEPRIYEGLLAKVFESSSFVFASSGPGGFASAKYEVRAGETLSVDPTNLFKTDLKTLAPKAGAKVGGQDLALSWKAYPDAAYYKITLLPEHFAASLKSNVDSHERVEATSFAIDGPMVPGGYHWWVTAYNANDERLSESPHDVKFTIR